MVFNDRTITDNTGRKKRNHELEETMDTAEKASRAKPSFPANMNHKFRTPLASVIGFAEAIGEEVRWERNEAGSLLCPPDIEKREGYSGDPRRSAEHFLPGGR